ncbi:MAG: glycine hydroxymethyltransferase, partial [Verrucomicrobia bacterium]|nr:glycine hydroxymethyltransferase [Verrucomicrobiota bacterium]
MTYLQRYFHKVPQTERDVSAIAFFASLDSVAKVAPSIACSIIQELRDQSSSLKLIASENYSSLSVQQAMGNLLTDKYAEGTPFHRFYAGCENVDAIEAEAVLEAKLLFGCDHAYVQPHSGADANLVAYLAAITHHVQVPQLQEMGKKSIDELTPTEWETFRRLLMGQKLMGFSLSSGGHLTHGYRHNISARMMVAVHYDVDPVTGALDYHKLAEQVKREKPTIFLAGYSSYPRRLNFAKMREIADSVGALFMVDMAHFAG